MAGERTEQATPRRLEQLRKQGQVARSVDLSAAVGLLASLLVVQQFGTTGVEQLGGFLQSRLNALGRADLSEPGLAELARGSWEFFFIVMMPLLVLVPIVGIAASLGQTGFMLSGYSLSPKFERISPVSGFSRLWSMRSAIELGKTVVKVAVLSWVMVLVLRDSLPSLMALSGSNVGGSAILLAQLLLRLGFTAGVALLVLGILDYGYQRWEFDRSSKMSKDELREDLKQTEGSPQIRQRIRRRQRELAARRMMQRVPQADVVITNPTHLAVALLYTAGEMQAPRVVAKGADLVAERIKQIARHHDVPIVENKPLAQALYRSVEIEGEIPIDLFQAVADVLAHIYTLRGRRPRLDGD